MKTTPAIRTVLLALTFVSGGFLAGRADDPRYDEPPKTQRNDRRLAAIRPIMAANCRMLLFRNVDLKPPLSNTDEVLERQPALRSGDTQVAGEDKVVLCPSSGNRACVHVHPRRSDPREFGGYPTSPS